MVETEMPKVSEGNRKRKRREKVYGFHSFAGRCCSQFFTGAFRDNIRQFLREFAVIEDYNIEGMPIWRTVLIEENDGVQIPLYCAEESVKQSASPFCVYCRRAGWSHHFVSKRRYHFIIPMSESSGKPLGAGESRRGAVFNLQTHLLHGLIHCNGFGHLLCINGREVGSKHVSGGEIMDLWDRICAILRSRKITVEDISKKRSMELRLLYSIAYGKPWFGSWGYKVCLGVTELEKAIEILSELPLDTVVKDFYSIDREMEIYRLIQNYQNASETPLISLRDLLRSMLKLKDRLPYIPAAKSKIPVRENQRPCRTIASLASHPSCRWPATRMELASHVIINTLKVNGVKWMSRQDVRDASRAHIGDTGLLDYVLKSIGDCVVGTHVVRRAVNPETKLIQFKIECVDGDTEEIRPLDRLDVYKELVYVYRYVIESYRPATPASLVLPVAVRTILDGKQLVKEWPFVDDDDAMLRFMCSLKLVGEVEVEEFGRVVAPPVLVVVPPHATIGELKQAVGEAMRDTYCIAERYEVSEVEGFEGEDEEVLFGVVESGVHLLVSGSGLSLSDVLRYEGGEGNGCRCVERDGEVRMMDEQRRDDGWGMH